MGTSRRNRVENSVPPITREMILAGMAEFDAGVGCVDPEGIIIAVYIAMRNLEPDHTSAKTYECRS